VFIVCLGYYTRTHVHAYEGVSKSFRIESITKYTLTTINTRETTQRVMAAKHTKLTQKNNDTTEPSGKDLYHLHFSLQAARPETFRCTLILICIPTTKCFVLASVRNM